MRYMLAVLLLLLAGCAGPIQGDPVDPVPVASGTGDEPTAATFLHRLSRI